MKEVLVIGNNHENRKEIVNTLLKVENIKLYEASNCEQGLEILAQNNIDIIYMYTNLKGQEELECAEKIRAISKHRFTNLILISENAEISKEAFKNMHCYNFYNRDNYNEDKIISELRMLLKITGTNKIEENEDQFIKLNIESKNYILNLKVDEILFIESQSRNIIIHTKIEKYNIYNMSIKKILNLLPKDIFVQSHRAYIINCNKIRKIKKYDRISWRACFDGYELEALMSDKYRDDVTKKIRENKKKLKK